MSDLAHNRGSLIIPRLKEPHHRLGHSLRAVAGCVGSVIDDDSVEWDRRRQKAIDNYESRTQGIGRLPGFRGVWQAHLVGGVGLDASVRIKWTQAGHVRTISHDGFGSLG